MSCFLILTSFFLGYLFCYVQIHTKIEENEQKQRFVKIDTKKNSIDISTEEKSIIFLLNGEPRNDTEITLEKND